MTFTRPAPRVKQMNDYTPKQKTVVLRRDPPETMCVPIPKFDYVRSPALLKAVSELDCMHCGRSGQTQAAHSNQAKHGKGRGIKASDIYVAALCFECHAALDQGPIGSRQWRVRMWRAAWINTCGELRIRGLWPVGVPIPTKEGKTA